MGRGCWKTVWFKPRCHEANILNTEARGLAWSVEHLLRSNCCIQKRPLCFSDNLPLVLSATIGRGRSHHLAKPLRKLAALSLATGSKVHVRWVASELKCNGKVKLLRKYPKSLEFRWRYDSQATFHFRHSAIPNFGPTSLSRSLVRALQNCRVP